MRCREERGFCEAMGAGRRWGHRAKAGSVREGGLEERWGLRAGDGGSVRGGEFREREGLRLGSVTPRHHRRSPPPPAVGEPRRD